MHQSKTMLKIILKQWNPKSFWSLDTILTNDNISVNLYLLSYPLIYYPGWVSKLEVNYKFLDRVLTVGTAQQIGTAARWDSNKTTLLNNLL